MKKVIIILFLFAFSLLTYKGKVENAFIEKIDLKLQEEEIGIVFIPMNKSSFLLIKTKENSIILPIYGKENPQKILERFGEEKPTYSYTDIINGENKVEEQNFKWKYKFLHFLWRKYTKLWLHLFCKWNKSFWK